MHGLCGTPFIFQGEEIGMTNPTYSVDEYEDIDLKNKYQEQVKEKHLLTEDEFLKVEHKIARDNGRTPMQWDASPNAGFTQGKPWYKVNPDYKQINVKTDKASKKSVFKYYQKLIDLRHKEDTLTKGKYQELMPDDSNIFAYYRILRDKCWLIVVNMTNHEIESDEIKDFIKGYTKVILHNYESKKISNILAPYEAYIIQK